QPHQQHQVECQSDGRQYAEEAVDGNDEDGHEEHRPLGGRNTLGNVLGTQARTDGALFSEIHRCRQTTGTQQQRQLRGLTLAVQTRDTELSAQRRLDGSETDDLLLFDERRDGNFLLYTLDALTHVAGDRLLFDEDHRHAAPDVVARGAIHQIAAVNG